MTVEDPEIWQPLSVRDGRRPPQELTWHEAVPVWLADPLCNWLESECHVFPQLRERLFARLQHAVGNASRWDYKTVIEGLDPKETLDWIDACLNIMTTSTPKSLHRSSAAELDDVLREGCSVWRVADDLDGLARRQDATVTAAVVKSVDMAEAVRPTAAIYLREAWNAAYGLHPDPSKAYSQALKAAEAAAIPVVVPKQVGATIGHVLGQLESQGDLYEVAIAGRGGSGGGVAAVREMIRLLFEGHTDRHAGVEPIIPITEESATMAIHLAATLVQWFTSGAVRRRT